METDKKQITIAVSVILQDAGEATRSIEIMKSVAENAPGGYTVRALFFTHGSKFDKKVLDNGFELYKVSPQLEGDGFLSALKTSTTNIVGDKSLAVELMKGEIEALKSCRPDIVLHGFWPFAGIARKMVLPVIPSVCFLPLPLEKTLMTTCLMRDIPDQIKLLTFLPEKLRRKIVSSMPKSFFNKIPLMKQINIIYAANECGWKGEQISSFFDMLKADLTIVNDFPFFYKDVPIPENFVITGPLYSQAAKGESVDPAIQKIFHKDTENQVNIFCTMGSSGKKEFLTEAVKAIVSLPGEHYHAAVLVPKAVCPIEDIAQLVKGKPNIYITDKFVPAKLVNALADITICHGGQGTVQTALKSGTPIIGFGMQPEQQINLDHVMLNGAGIRIPSPRFNSRNILKAIRKVSGNSSYRENSKRLGGMMSDENSSKDTADAIWNFTVKRF